MPTVTLLTHTDAPEKIVAAAARLCYSPATVEQLLDGLDAEKTAGFVEMLAEIGHESPIEHCTFTFAIEGVSRAFLAQMTRHRIASYSVQSQRYVEESSFEWVMPPAVEAVPEAKDAFLAAMEQAQRQYSTIAGILQRNYEQQLLEKGEEEKSARRKANKMAIEDARFVLPNACDTKMVVTMNARSLLNFFRHRCCRRAQWEIRAVAEEMLRLVCPVAPRLFSRSGPPCVRGACTEGKMSCGEMEEVRRYYREIQEQSRAQ